MSAMFLGFLCIFEISSYFYLSSVYLDRICSCRVKANSMRQKLKELQEANEANEAKEAEQA